MSANDNETVKKNPPVTILIADDEPSIRNGLNTAIEWDAIPAMVIGLAADGMEALEFIQTYHPDIAITDIRMPELNGLELIQRAKELGIDTQFVILSGYDDFTYAQKAIHLGAKSYVLKPFKPEELLAELKELAKEIVKDRQTNEFLRNTDLSDLQHSTKIFFLNQLLQNEIRRNDEIDKRLRDLQLTITNGPTQVLVFSFYHTEEPTTEDMEAIQSRIHQILAPIPHELWKMNSNQLVAITNLNEENNLSQIRTLATGCLEVLADSPLLRVSVGIGDAVDSLADCYYSYTRAMLALSYRIYEPEPRAPGLEVYDSSMISNHAPSLTPNNVDTKSLTDAICQGKHIDIKNYCERFFRSLFAETPPHLRPADKFTGTSVHQPSTRYLPMPPPSFVRGMCIYLIADVQKSLMNYTRLGPEAFPEIAYIEINQLNTIQEIKEWMTALFTKYSDDVMINAANKNDTIIEQTMQYIHSHIDQKIKAEDIAAHVNLSVAYFTIYFKSKTNINFRDYVLNTKIDYAKELLSHPNIPVGQVSDQLGYEDYRSFYRAFKNVTGLTPSEYQQQYDVRRKQNSKGKNAP